MQKPKIKEIIVIISFVFLSAVLGWIQFWPQKQRVLIKSARSEEKETEPLVLPGKIKAERKVDLKFATSGKLVWVGVKVGDRVKKGQVIASLDRRELEKDFKKAMNNYLTERWDFEQTQDNYRPTKEKRLITDAIKRILEKAQFDLNNAVLDVEIARLALEYATLTSPIDGIVIRVDQPIAGVNITPAKAIFSIADPNSLYFEAEADEEEVVQIREGMKGKITLDAYPNRELASQIRLIEFAPISTKGVVSYAVHCSLPDKLGLDLRLEMNGEIEISPQ